MTFVISTRRDPDRKAGAKRVRGWLVLALAVAVSGAAGCQEDQLLRTAPGTQTPALTNPSTARPTGSAARPSEAFPSWEELRSRPLQFPAVSVDAACPTSQERLIRPYEGAFQEFLVLGEGPAYPTIPAGPKLVHDSTWTAQDGRRYHKGLWIVAESYLGPVLARGRHLHGTAEIHFDDGLSPPSNELRIEAIPSGYRDRPSSWSVSEAGCYAIQIDGSTFSKVVVFEVRQ